MGRLAIGILATLSLVVLSAAGARALEIPCNQTASKGFLPPMGIQTGGTDKENSQPDLLVNGLCQVKPSNAKSGGSYYYRHVNIVDGGRLVFLESSADSPGQHNIDFYARAIIVEKGGRMVAGETVPFGTEGGVLTIHLYGTDQSKGNPVTNPGLGVFCKTQQNHDPQTNIGPCGVPWTTWTNDGTKPLDLPGPVNDYFYKYDGLYGDTATALDPTDTDPSTLNQAVPGYFGYKVLAVSYGGTLTLRGYKGAFYPNLANNTECVTPAELNNNLYSGTSWIRLAGNLNRTSGPPLKTLTLSRSPCGKWQKNDLVVVTTTDYLPGHSELLKLDSTPNGAEVEFHACPQSGVGGPLVDPTCPGSAGLAFPHNGTRYTLGDRLSAAGGRLGLDPLLVSRGAETRAAVALLTRSIRIVSGGDFPADTFDCPPGTPSVNCATARNPKYSFGAHTVFRQGFQQLDIQGVEFYQMGQGGRLAHYPVHFHMARKTPAGTLIADSSVHDSMTRWYVIHSTLGVTLERNVGYLSIGHGYYLEDATETDNKFYSNIGIFARAGVANLQNPRQVPGILADNGGSPAQLLRVTSDYNYPSVFWITNGWNDFQGNMAAGAGTCGSCYWFVPAFNAGMPGMAMKWSGYSALQKDVGFEGTTPLKSFYQNHCTTAEYSFNTVGEVAPCNGVNPYNSQAAGFINAVQSIAPTPPAPTDPNIAADTYYPHFNTGGSRKATTCPAAPTPTDPDAHDCSAVNVCTNGTEGLTNCAVTVLDHYTSSFNWADFNVSALWLRPFWYLLDNSVISDVQNAGVTFVTGGDYSHSSVIEGIWQLASHSVFIGTTQSTNAFAASAGPFSTASGVTCKFNGNNCLNVDQGISMPLSNFGVEQRLYSIYDGPNYQDSNAYLDIKTAPCKSFATCMYWNTNGVRKNPAVGAAPTDGYLPNAAIGWKQPNGFYYPPVFHSNNLFFGDVDIRHYVNIPLFKALSTNPPEVGTYITDQTEVAKEYINPGWTFSGFTEVDRQTVLNDDDGSLGGLVSKANLPGSAPFPETTMVNHDAFFAAPIQTPECKSNLGVNPPTRECSANAQTPPTAETSPYHYVTLAISPDCANTDGCGSYAGDPVFSNPPTNTRATSLFGRGGRWSRDCAGPYCYGVRLFRQDLTGSDVAGSESREWAQWRDPTLGCSTNPTTLQCQFPFLRMGTQSTWQRSAMTVNHGTYYVDTSVSQSKQALSRLNDSNTPYFDCSNVPSPAPCQPLSVNTFVGGHTYYFYFIYAKGTTQQVYQMYVGENFIPDTAVKAIRMDISSGPYKPVGFPTPPPVPWDSNWKHEMILGFDGKKDVLQVTVDFRNFAKELDPANSSGGNLTNPTCKPSSFCSWSNNKCGCSLKADDPLLRANPNLRASCEHACNVWAIKDLDCPPAGCIGFSVTLPSGSSGFVANDQYKRPNPTPFRGIGWAATFDHTKVPPDSTGTAANSCHYSPLPNNPNCPGAN